MTAFLLIRNKVVVVVAEAVAEVVDHESSH
jgi:hypothetical protein